MRARYRLAIFDVDGTICDSYYTITKTLRLTLREWCGLEISDLEQLRRYIGPPLDDILADFGLEGERLAGAYDFFRSSYNDALDETVMYEGIPRLLERLKAAGSLLAIASSKNVGVIKGLLERDGMADLFDFVAGLEEDHYRETKSEAVARVLSHFGLPAGTPDAVMVGDRFFDAAGARDSGIAFVAAGYGLADLGEFVPYPMVFYAPTVAALGDYLIPKRENLT